MFCGVSSAALLGLIKQKVPVLDTGMTFLMIVDSRPRVFSQEEHRVIVLKGRHCLQRARALLTGNIRILIARRNSASKKLQ